MCGAGARDPVTGQWAAVGGRGRRWAAVGGGGRQMACLPRPALGTLSCSALLGLLSARL